MAKKNNPYSKTQVDELKRQLYGVVEYLQQFDPSYMEDRTDWKLAPNGGLIPVVIATIEDQIRTAISTVKQAVLFIISLHDNEAYDDNVQDHIDIVTSKLEDIKKHYMSKQLTHITDRYVTLSSTDSKGKPRSVRVLSITKERQVEARNKISEEILRILPSIDVIKTYATIEARGGYEISEAMMMYIERTRYEQ